LVAAWLALGAGGASADGVYDRKLEKAMKEIIAKRVDGPLRGSLRREWRPGPDKTISVAGRTTIELAAQGSILTLVLLPPSPEATASIDALRTSLSDTPTVRPTTGTASTGG